MNINKFYNAAAGDGGKGGNPAPVTKEDVLKELGTIKTALEANLTKKADEQTKNFQEKLDEVNKTIKGLQEAKPEVSSEEFKKVSDELAVTIKALDVVQTRQKNDGRKSSGGTIEDMSLQGQIKSALKDKEDGIKTGKILSKSIEEQGMTLKAVGDMTVLANVSTGVVPNTYRSGLVPQPFESIHLRNIVSVTPSETDSYHFYRHASTGEGAITWQGNEMGTKAQFDEDLTEVTVNLDYLAGYITISRKMLRNFSGLQAYLTKWLPEKYYSTEDTKGYQYFIANATGVGNADTGGGIIRQVIRTIGLQKKAKYNVTGIVMDGATWANILTYTTTAGEFTQPIGVVTISATGQLMVCGIPVYTASWVGGDEVLLGDWKYFEIIQSEALSLGFFEQDGDNVKKNKITARIEASVAFAMLDPKAFVVLSVEAVS